MRTFEGLLWFVSAVWVVWWLVRNLRVERTSPWRRSPWRSPAVTWRWRVPGSTWTDLRDPGGPVGRDAAVALGEQPDPVEALDSSCACGSDRGGRHRRRGASTIFPVFTYAKLSGPYGTGTAEYELKHGPRGRDLVIQAWYPTAAGDRGEPVGITSRPELLQAAYASFTGLPKPLFDNIRFVKTHTILNAAVAPGQPRYPVILFSHGPLSANRSQSVFQMEALASRGFVVVAIDHTGYASTTIFPDGHSVPPSPVRRGRSSSMPAPRTC